MFELLHALPLLVKAAILGLVEGITEFLPISSTGHLILAGSLLGFTGEKEKLFDVAIQTGAMFSVLWYYRARIGAVIGGLASQARAQRFAVNVVVAFLPAAVLGVLFASAIKAWLFKPMPVALALVVGGVVILWVESGWSGARRAPRIESVDEMRVADALKVGCAQALALVPGTESRRHDDHRRDVVRTVAQGGHRVLVLPGDPDDGGRGGLGHLEIPRAGSIADLPLFALGWRRRFSSR